MTEQIGHYRLIERIAAGGMGEVFKAKLLRGAGFEKTVAVKRMLPHLARSEEFEARFCAEARLSARLNHANIVHIYDFGTQNGSLFLAMEYIDGVDLGSLLGRLAEQGETLGLSHALYILAQVLRGLDYAHRMTDDSGVSLRLIHRDISPGNILLSVEGEVKLSDFGLASARQSEDEDLMVGKLPYLPPEQVAGEPLDRRSDLYSLGLVFYEMVFGRKAFHESLPRDALLRGIVAGAFDIPPRADVPEEVRDLLRRATARQKSDRYASAREMLDETERLREQFRQEGERPLSDLIVRLFPDRRSNPATAPEKTLLAPRPIAQTPAPEGEVAHSLPDPPLPAKAAIRPVRILALLILLVGVAAAGFWWLQPVYGTLRIASEPPGAAVWLNGVDTGLRTPATVVELIPELDYELTLTLAAYEPVGHRVTVSPRSKETLSFVLERQRRAVKIETEPAALRVELNGHALDGVTPLDAPPLEVGVKHMLRIEGADYIPHQSEFILEPSDEPHTIRVRLESLYRDLRVQLSPADSLLLVDGERVAGESPFTLTGLLPRRAVQIVATRQGYISRQETVIPQEHSGPLVLELVPFTASLRLEGQGLSASVDGVATSLPLRLDEIQKGHRLISVSVPGGSGRLVMRLGASQVRDRVGRWVTQAEVSLDAQPWASVQVDDRPPVTTPQSGISLSSGRHRLAFTLGGDGKRHELTLHVQ